MKELSIEDKAKRYDEAIKVAQRFYNNSAAITKKGLEDIFPELAESDDEKVRKEILEFFSQFENGELRGVDISSWIAWLEKQGTPAKLSEEEQNRFAKGVLTSCALSFIDYLDAHKYEGKMCVSNGECEDIENAFHNAMWDRLHRYYCKYIEKQGEKGINGKNREIPFSEQKPALSEEDEKYLIYNIEQDYRDKLNNNPPESLRPYYNKVISLLKSIRHQKQWKPSDEQIEILDMVLTNESMDDNVARILRELREQLKKLREG